MDKRFVITYMPPLTAEIQQPLKECRKYKKSKIGIVISFFMYLILIPAVIFLGIVLFEGKNYNIISLIIAVLAILPFFTAFERSKVGARELVVISVMIAVSVVGRLIFAPVPGFKPVTAITIITAIAFGPQAGFMTGAMSALVSNIFYGQGPWTPFQMFAWGISGFISGLLFYGKKQPNLILTCLVGALSGVLFSVLMDIWTVLSMDGAWNWTRYAAAIISAMPFTLSYAISNVFFIIILMNPFLNKLNYIKEKYSIFRN